MRVELPQTGFGTTRTKRYFMRRKGRVFRIEDSRSIRSITREIHTRPDIDAYEHIRFNLADKHNRYKNPILSMESDDDTVPLAVHEQIARYVGGILHRKYRCQVQLVWSGNKSYHIHFRIKRRNLLEAEAVAIQKYLTDRMEARVRRKFSLPTFTFDQSVAGRLGLVRLGDGTRLKTNDRPVHVHQDIIEYLHSNFSDIDVYLPVGPGLKTALQSASIRKARSRTKQKRPALPLPSDQELRDYAKFLRREGSTVRPNHWATRDGTEAVMICYWGEKDRNPSCVLARDSHFVTDSRGKKHTVVFSYNDYLQATKNDLRSGQYGTPNPDPVRVTTQNPQQSAARPK